MRLFTPHSRPAAFARLRVFSALFTIMLACCLLVPGSAAAKPRVWPITGTFRTQVQPPSACPPPYTLCSTGTVSGELEGTVFVVIENSTVTFDASGIPFSSYTGSITITTKRGTLAGRVNGQVRLTDGTLASTVIFTRGTQAYHDTFGALKVKGLFNLVTGSEVDTFVGALYRR